MRLLELAYAEKPGDPVLAFNLGWVYQKSNQAERALPLLQLCRQSLAPQVSITPKVYRLLGQVLEQLGRLDEALEALSTGRRLFPGDVELLLHDGFLLRKQKKYDEAENCFRRILAFPPGTYPVGLDLGLRSFKTRNALAELLQEQGKLEDAALEWRVALAEQPRFAAGWVGLAEIAASCSQHSEALALLDRVVAADPQTEKRITLLRGRLNQTKALPSVKTPAAVTKFVSTSSGTPTTVLKPRLDRS